jgi:metal-responsive CopG/Arc/MetJ family transcriptional regulator
MAKTNLQVRIPEEIESQISELAPHSKSEFVRQAIEEKIRRERDRRREEQWIEALKKNPEDPKEAKKWLKIERESWGPR